MKIPGKLTFLEHNLVPKPLKLEVSFKVQGPGISLMA